MRDIFIITLLLVTFQFANSQQIKKTATPLKETATPARNGITNAKSAVSETKSDNKSYTTTPIVVAKNTIEEGKHQISFFVGGGVSTFKYKPQYGTQNDGLGFTIGLNYAYFWHPKWGVSIGFSADSYNSSFELLNSETSQLTVDGDLDNDGITDEFFLITKFKDFKEEQTAILIGLPVELQFRQPFSQKTGIIIGVGPKFATTISSKSQVTKGSYTTEGLYQKYGTNALIKDGPGFSTYEPRASVKTDIGIGISVIGDLSFYYKINPAFILSVGPYCEYQVNTIKGKSDVQMVQYKTESLSDATSNYNPILTSSTSNGANRFAVGGKIGITYDFGGAQTVKNRKALLNAQEAARLAELRRQATADSLANVQRLTDLRNKAIADSVANAKRLADETARLALLKRLAEQQRIKDSIENAKNVAVVMDIKTKTLSEDELTLLKRPIIFEKGSANITSQSKINAQQIGEMLSHHPSLLLKITGHTCDLGDDQANYRLGLKRAQTLFREFTQAGVMPYQISTFSKGETQPLFPNTNEDNRRKNRRVVVVIEDK